MGRSGLSPEQVELTRRVNELLTKVLQREVDQEWGDGRRVLLRVEGPLAIAVERVGIRKRRTAVTLAWEGQPLQGLLAYTPDWHRHDQEYQTLVGGRASFDLPPPGGGDVRLSFSAGSIVHAPVSIRNAVVVDPELRDSTGLWIQRPLPDPPAR